MEPIKLYWRPFGPNPQKVVTILEELRIPYRGEYVDFEDINKRPYSDICPNGKVPAINDPNTGVTLWESGAIVHYLIDKYDKEEKLSYQSEPEKYLLQQWEHFQSSGQGPYFGQASWFILFHSEEVESAQERYINELKRIVSVLDRFLENREWLVGNKCTYADLTFFPWNNNIGRFIMRDRKEWDIEDFPNFKRWHEAIKGRPSVQKASKMTDVTHVSSESPEQPEGATDEFILNRATSRQKQLQGKAT